MHCQMAVPQDAKPKVNHFAASQVVIQLLEVINEVTEHMVEEEETEET